MFKLYALQALVAGQFVGLHTHREPDAIHFRSDRRVDCVSMLLQCSARNWVGCPFPCGDPVKPDIVLPQNALPENAWVILTLLHALAPTPVGGGTSPTPSNGGGTSPTPNYVPPTPNYLPPTPFYMPPTPMYLPPTPMYLPPTPMYLPPTPRSDNDDDEDGNNGNGKGNGKGSGTDNGIGNDFTNNGNQFGRVLIRRRKQG